MAPVTFLLPALLLAAAAGAAPRPLEDFPVWQAMEGYWRGDLDYYDGDGEPITRDYDGIFRIEIDGTDFRQTNWMFYPPGPAAARLSRGLAGPDEGVEVVINTRGRAVDDAGTMRVDLIDHLFDYEGGETTRVVSDTVVIYDYRDPETGILQHLQMVNLGAPDQRIRSAQGFDPHRWLRDPITGDYRVDEEGERLRNPRFGRLRAFSSFRETRMDAADFEAVRAELREKHNVTVLVTAGVTPDAPSNIERLDAPVTDCDRLAAHPFDARRVAGGVAREDMDRPAAIGACSAAVEREPDVDRLRYQLGRALFYDGRVEAALPHLERAVELQYPQALFVLGYLLETPEGLPEDDCRAALLWRLAALQDHFYAEYSFAEKVLDGSFAACPVRQDRAEVLRFLRSAAEKAAWTGLESRIAELIARLEEETG